MKPSRTAEFVKTDEQLADACHVHVRSITNYKKDGSFPKRDAARGWNVRKAQDWIAGRRVQLEEARAAAKAAGRTLDEVRIGKYLAETLRIRLKYQQERGQMTPASEYRAFVRDACTLFLETLDRVVNGISAKLRDPEALKVLESETGAARAWFTERAEKKADEEPGRTADG